MRMLRKYRRRSREKNWGRMMKKYRWKSREKDKGSRKEKKGGAGKKIKGEG